MLGDSGSGLILALFADVGGSGQVLNVRLVLQYIRAEFNISDSDLRCNNEST